MHNETVRIAEQSVIGAIILDEKVLVQVNSLITPEDFLFDDLKACYRAILEVSSKGKPVDFLTVLSQLAASGDYPEKQIKTLLSECAELTPSIRNTENYAKIILNSKKSRKIQEIASSVLADGINSENPDETANQMISELFETVKKQQLKGLQNIGDVGLKLFESYGKPTAPYINTGFSRLDEKLKGMSAGNLITLASRPKIGKTAFALSIAENVAKTGKIVAFYSLEMSGLEIYERMLSKAAEIPMNTLIDRKFKDKRRPEKVRVNEICKISETIDKNYDLPIKISENPSCTVNDIRIETKQLIAENRLKSRTELGLIVIDYLQLMSSNRRYDTRNLEVGAICRDLKCLAAELEVPILCLSQLNRTSDENSRPSPSELRDSGSIEQDANKLMLMWCVEKNLNELGMVESKTVGVDVALNRRGNNGVTLFNFNGNYMEFSELDRVYEESKTTEKNAWRA